MRSVMLFGVIDFFARLASLLLKPWCIMIEQDAVDSSEPSEAVKE